MDVSVIVAAAGSFMVSERVIRAKTTVVFIMGCVLCYDLTRHAQDESSLRVYRGPALLAFTLMCIAFSLRIWRRSGVACDELLFLPDTPFASTAQTATTDDVTTAAAAASAAATATASVEKKAMVVEMVPKMSSSSSNDNNSSNNSRDVITSEGDAAAGGTGADRLQRHEAATSDPEHDDDDDEMLPILLNAAEDIETGTIKTPNAATASDQDNHPNDDDDNILQYLFCNTNKKKLPKDPNTTSTNSSSSSGESPPALERSPNIDSSFSSPADDAAYAPSGPSVAGAAIDLCLPVLINFHLFIMASNPAYAGASSVPPNVLPLIFLTILLVRLIVPFSSRRRFYSTLRYIIFAPCHRVQFRDHFLADVLTSFVRPLKDLAFSFFYYCVAIKSLVWPGSPALEQTGKILHDSWLLHNIILPALAILPLWFKFVQTLRQSYDSGKRWPHLPNAFKYFSAALIILYAMAHREDRRSTWWIICFFLATLYQIWWDIFMDWELFILLPKTPQQLILSESSSSLGMCNVSSLSPTSYIFLFHRYIIQPTADTIRQLYNRVPGWDQVALRRKRLYKSDTFYWHIVCFNASLRFLWMLSFIPAYHFSTTTGKTIATFSFDLQSYVGFGISALEIIRRCLWGILRLEVETLRMTDPDLSLSTGMLEKEEEDHHHGDDSGGTTTATSTTKSSSFGSWRSSSDRKTSMSDDGIDTDDNSEQDELSSFMRKSTFPDILERWKNSFSVGLQQRCCTFSKTCRNVAFIIELTLWAVALLVLGNWIVWV